MALHPEPTEILRKELHALESLHDVDALLSLPSMSGFINETLRMYPTTPTGGNRITPPEGLNVAGRYIPGGITIVAPAYNIGRREIPDPGLQNPLFSRYRTRGLTFRLNHRGKFLSAAK